MSDNLPDIRPIQEVEEISDEEKNMNRIVFNWDSHFGSNSECA